MSDLKIGDRVTGIKGNTRVTGTVMNIKEGHVHIKAPVSGVYAPLVSIVPLHKVTKLGEGAMKRKAEAEDDAGMSDYMHHAQTSSAPFDNAKPAKPHQDQFGNKIKIGNVAKNLAKQGMRGVKKEEVEQIDEMDKEMPLSREQRDNMAKQKPAEYAKLYNKVSPEMRKKLNLPAKLPEEVEQVDEVNARHSLEAAQAALTPRAKNVKAALSNTARDKAATNKYARRISKISPDYKPKDVKDNLRSMGEDLNSRKVYEPTSAQALNPGLRAKIDAASNAQKPRPLSGMRPIGKIKLMTRKEEVEQVEEGYKGRRAFGSAYDKTHDPFQDSKRAFKSRELEHELAHEAPSGPAHHDQTPHDVHIDGKKWKTFGSAGHAHNVANKLSISGKRASVHKTPIAEKAPPGWEGTVKAMKKHSEIDNPFALAWWMKRKGAKSHKGEK
jgi:hypothetical protein